ncbi:MAG: GerMN domain-containing protein [Mollicutes bacterium]|nr:GerMN domain-containing protein [Mollicutes bacterium]
MLKKMITKKILISTFCLFALFLLYMIPKDTIYTLKDIKQEVNYVEQNKNLQTVFLLDKDQMLGKTEYVSDVLSSQDINKQVTDSISVLIKDGANESKVPNGFQAIIPSDTKIISSSFENGIYKINFSKELLDVKEDMEEKIVEAIVFTATSNKNVKQVIIYIDGDTLTYLPKSKTYIPATLDRSFGINKTFHISSTDHIQSVIVYFLKEYNQEEYYVPVTKYVNDQREKVKIIIDELSSSQVYDSNLMSYLDSNVKLEAATVEDDVLHLNFNQNIMSSLDDEPILEEVIYTIALSIQDNYDVSQVSFEVENQEIYKTVLKTLD